MITRVLMIAVLVAPWMLGNGAAASDARAPRAGVPAVLGLPPKNCPASTHFVALFNLFDDGKSYGGYSGGAPIWLAGLAGPPATLRFGAMADRSYQPGYGWEHKVLFVLKRGYPGSVNLSGGSLQGHASIWLDAVELAAPDGPTRRLVLEARRQKAFAGGAGPRQWPTFPGGIIVPRAGCYYLDAHWPGGSWRVNFAAGR